jgi:hypothetical protein
MSLLDSASLVVTPNGTKTSKLYSVVPSSGAGDLDVTRATTATRVNSNGLIESVASNVPRLDYSNGSCPSILVEPQRTNLASYSEQFNNAYWTSFESSISANATASPDGNVTADKIIDTTVNTIHANFKGFLITTESTLSYFVKSAEYSRVAIGNFSDGGEAVFNLSTGTVVSTSSNWKNSTITALANGWFKISATTNGVIGAKAIGVQLVNNSGALSFAGTGSSGLYIWGAQLEAGSYATSYIPTTSASVTRNADVISKTGISSLIGQTEGVLYFDGIVNNIQNANSNILNTNKSPDTISTFQLSKSKSDNKFRFDLFLGNGTFSSIILNSSNAFTNGTRTKIAIRYKSGDFAMYINGNLEDSDTSTFTNNGTKSELFLNDAVTYFNFQESVSFNNVALWKIALTNTQLATLTTI